MLELDLCVVTLLNEAFYRNHGFILFISTGNIFSKHSSSGGGKTLMCLVLFALHVIIHVKFTALIESLKVSKLLYNDWIATNFLRRVIEIP